jgi:thiamine-monophosphate kinase
MAITRSGARVGDDVWVSGTLGGAMLALAALQGRTTVDEDALARLRLRLERPEPRVPLGEALRGIASAALDVSDGLTGDLAHILAASRVGACLELAAIPCDNALAGKLPTERALALDCLLAGGDDYELCFTAAAKERERVLAAGRSCGVSVSRIGVITGERGLRVIDADGEAMTSLPRAFDHFVG